MRQIRKSGRQRKRERERKNERGRTNAIHAAAEDAEIDTAQPQAGRQNRPDNEKVAATVMKENLPHATTATSGRAGAVRVHVWRGCGVVHNHHNDECRRVEGKTRRQRGEGIRERGTCGWREGANEKTTSKERERERMRHNMANKDKEMKRRGGEVWKVARETKSENKIEGATHTRTDTSRETERERPGKRYTHRE